ncbi:trypsin-2-like [Schistocerca americana]|uniref:trypsin-2-like n=1 Tax=Schistocerca americana TaxID=7009 RepID=UPI001F4F48F2|nr:trypsin-2-like [Schistocerca americana]
MWKIVVCAFAVASVWPCVQSAPRIVNGTSVDIEDYPWMASIQFEDGHKCGGVIISETWVLTCAECVQKFDPSYYFVRVGTSIRDTGGILYNVTKTAHNSHYSSTSMDYDIGAAQILGTFTFNEKIQPIPLTTVEPEAGTLVSITGWGTVYSGSYLADQLQMVELYIVDRDVCNDAYDGLGKVSVRKICAWWPGGGRDRCGPDYGGPMVLDGVLVGVISSWGNGCALPGWPSVYANIANAEIRQWINDTTGV